MRVWHGLHPKLMARGRWGKSGPLPIVRGSVIRVDVEHLPKRSMGVKKTLWLWWSGPGEPDLDLCWRAYLRRFDIEHNAASLIMRRRAPSPLVRAVSGFELFALSQCLEKSEQPVGRSVTTGSDSRWCRPGDRALLQRKVGVEIDLRRAGSRMTQP